MNRTFKYLILFFTFLSIKDTGFSQIHYDSITIFRVKDYPSPMFKIRYDSTRFLDYTIELVHVLNVSYPGLADSAHPGELIDYLDCKGWFFLKRGTKTIQTICYVNMSAVGGCSGIYIPKKQPRNDCFLMAKYGDYDGNTILIDKDGTIKKMQGGIIQVSPDNRYLFSNYESDISGVTIYDLEKHKILFTPDSDKVSTNLRDVEIRTWYYQDQKYMAGVYTADEEGEYPDTLHITVATYDLKKNKIRYTKANKDFLKSSNVLPDYTPYDFKDGRKSCHCGR